MGLSAKARLEVAAPYDLVSATPPARAFSAMSWLVASPAYEGYQPPTEPGPVDPGPGVFRPGVADVRLGSTAIVRVFFTDRDKQPLAATGVSIRARRPDGSEVTGMVAPGTSTGRFFTRFVCDMPGVWLAKGECTGPMVARDDARWTCSSLRYDEP